MISSRSVALKPSAGAPVGQVSNSQGAVRGVGVVVLDEVPDLLSAGADKTTLCRCGMRRHYYWNKNDLTS